jgi:hypothetical protein
LTGREAGSQPTRGRPHQLRQDDRGEQSESTIDNKDRRLRVS